MSSENTNNTAAEIAESNKRAALAGQWRTPPLPVFPTSGDPNSANDIPLPPINELPDTTEDYAKALQEAYRRGAEAAAKMASVQQQQQPTSMISTVSCPDFAKTEPPILPPPIPNPLNAAPSASMPPPPPPPTTTSAAPQVSSFSTHPPPPIHQPRSMSMPDMNSYGAAEEEKRQKRLARNRASARLRRLRKKNLVDAYETEVGILEKTLAALKAHEWGAQDDSRALTEALSMDRGQQQLSAEERKQAATDILSQQLEYIGMLEEIMQEQFVLHSLASSNELDDVKELLQLTPDQLQQLSDQAAGWESEWKALQTVKASLQAMKDNNWLWNEGCTAVAEEFMSILHKNQVSKFLLWADHNVDAIDELDIVNAPSGVPQGPIFHFGVNSNPDSLLEEESKSS